MTGSEVAASRLALLKASPDCISYFVNWNFDPLRGITLSLYGAYPTAEIFIELTDGPITRVQSFQSRMRAIEPGLRRADMLLVDQADAFALARKLSRGWPGKRKARGGP